MSDALERAVRGLADKIDRLDLTDDERSVLASLMMRAAKDAPEVEGFGLLTDDGTLVFKADGGLAPTDKSMLVLGDGNALKGIRLGLGLDSPKPDR